MPQLLYLTLLPAFSWFGGSQGEWFMPFTMGRTCASDTKTACALLGRVPISGLHHRLTYSHTSVAGRDTELNHHM